MARSSYYFTSESVGEGHPDKVCDRISDEVVDAFFRIGPQEGWNPKDIRVAAETMATTNFVVIGGEVRGPATITKDLVAHLARLAIRDIGYEQDGFHWETAEIQVKLHAQSAHIAQGVDASGNKDEGAGDQGIMFGYACRETAELMPAPLYYSHKILELMAKARHAKSGDAAKLGPDAKSQVTVRYENGKPKAATQIVVSTQHLDESLTSQDVRAICEPYVREALSGLEIAKDCVWHVNPTGAFVIGGRTAIRASRAARSSSTPMAARPRMAAARSRARTRPRSTVRRPTPRAIWRRTWSRRGSPSAARSSSPMRSASPGRCRSTPTCTAPDRSTRASSRPF